MARGRNAKKKAPPNETFLQRQSRLARDKEFAEQRDRPLVTDEMARQGQYEEGWTEIDGKRARVVINRGGATVERWLNAASDEHIGEKERAAIRYCLALWQKIDRKGPRTVIVDGDGDGMSEHEALSELAAFKRKFPPRYWATFENICRFGEAAPTRHAKVTVALVAGMIAMWCNL